MRKLVALGGILALVLAVVFGVMALTGGRDGAKAQVEQFHGAGIAKQCSPLRGVGQTTNCSIRVTYNDDFGDTIHIGQAFDMVSNLGGPTREPPSGDLPISAVSGNTTCTVGGTLPCNIGPVLGALAAGQVTFLSNQYVIQANDPIPLDDQGNAEVQDLCDAPGTSGCSTVENLIQFPASTIIAKPAITVTKSCTDASAPGQPINFSGTVTNTGTVTLNNVTVVDDHAGTVLTLASLAAGASSSYSGSYVPSSSPSTDTVTATGTDVIAESVTATASATCKILTAPTISVTKSCSDASAPGQPINFSGTVTNTGTVTLNNVTVVDDHAGNVLTLASLAAGASSPYSGSYVPISNPSTDTVTASGTDAINDGPPATATASATCKIIAPTPTATNTNTPVPSTSTPTEEAAPHRHHTATPATTNTPRPTATPKLVSTVLPIVVTPPPAPEVMEMPATGDGPSSAGSALQTVSLLVAVLSVMAISLGCLGLGRRRARKT